MTASGSLRWPGSSSPRTPGSSAVAESGPDGFLQHQAVFARGVAMDVQGVDRPAVLVTGQLDVHQAAAFRQDRAQVRVPDGRPEQQLRGQRRARRVMALLDGTNRTTMSAWRPCGRMKASDSGSRRSSSASTCCRV